MQKFKKVALSQAHAKKQKIKKVVLSHAHAQKQKITKVVLSAEKQKINFIKVFLSESHEGKEIED